LKGSWNQKVSHGVGMAERISGARSGLHGVAEARARLIDAVTTVTGIESVALDDALGRVLAGPVAASVNVPPADNSAMDGYAMSAVALRERGGALPVSTRIQAGDSPEPLAPGTAARIFTGAVVPDGADAVVMQEKTSEHDGKVYVDFVQNGHGRLLVAPFCVRPRSGAPVSAPLLWEEVTHELRIEDHTIVTMPERMERLGEDPMRSVLDEEPDLLAALGRLKDRFDQE